MIRHAKAYALSLVAFTIGCKSCHENKPFTPYTLGDSSAAPADSASGRPPAPVVSGSRDDAGAPPSFAIVEGSPPPGDGKSWPLGDAVVAAPPGRTFGVGLTLDVDGDGANDLVAWARSPDGLRGELWFASGKATDAAKVIAALPSDLSVAGCSARASIQLVGPKAVAFDYEPRCSARARERPSRWIALFVERSHEMALGVELRVAPLREGQTIKASFDTSDRDGDGRPDVGVKLALSSGKATNEVTLGFLDRPAGLSRDASEPEASLKVLVATIASDAKARTRAAGVAPASAAFQALFSTICEEGGHALVTTSAGPVRCGDGHLVEDALVAEVEAAVNLAEPATALAAAARLDALSSKPRKDIEKLITKSVPVVNATLAKKTTASPVVVSAPSFAPLAFLPSGDLLVKTKDGAVRVDKSSFAEAPEALAVFQSKLAWPPETPKWTLASIARRCADQSLVARFDVASGDPIEIALPSPPRPKCADAASLPVTMLGDTPHGSLFAIGPELFAVPWADPPKPDAADTLASPSGLTVPFGTARSPDGKTIALATSRGVLVLAIESSGKQGKGQLWKSADLDGATSCVPADGAKRIACVSGTSAAIFDSK